MRKCVIGSDADTKWYENLEELKQFINNNKKRPSCKAKDMNEKTLGLWIKIIKRIMQRINNL